ncbi:MAG: threonylcarbamoyl-AMP synthase [Candidatus Gastranaerophilales bacterium]|nr:threonylcarbamoyl-AMP synthase [Candidatus Gastranaerophilales bacterium]
MQLNKGEILAFKTDTVWGFGCDPNDDEAVLKIYEIKKRDINKPLILMSNNFSHLEKYIQNVPEYAYSLIKKYLPGGLTLIFEKSQLCSCNITRGYSTVGIRIPDSIEFSDLINSLACKVLATTSCNISSEEPVKNYKEASEKFSEFATIIKPIEDKENENIPSTVILCEKDGYKVLRNGAIKL